MKTYRVMGIVFVASLVCLVGMVQADTTNLVSNGEFDTDMAGWSFPAGSGGRFDGTEANPSPDGPSAYMNLATWLATTPTGDLLAGQTYKVSFLARILGAAGTTNEVDETLYAHVNSNTNGVIAPYTARLTGTWQRYSFQFTPTATEASGNYGLAFLDCAGNAGYGTDAAGWCQFGIDSVSLTAVPEPSAVLLSFTGLFGLLAYAWRKRS